MNLSPQWLVSIQNSNNLASLLIRGKFPKGTDCEEDNSADNGFVSEFNAKKHIYI